MKYVTFRIFVLIDLFQYTVRSKITRCTERHHYADGIYSRVCTLLQYTSSNFDEYSLGTLQDHRVILFEQQTKKKYNIPYSRIEF
jgi:hypothetical protein